jgi:hypothetical protein
MVLYAVYSECAHKLRVMSEFMQPVDLAWLISGTATRLARARFRSPRSASTSKLRKTHARTKLASLEDKGIDRLLFRSSLTSVV